MSSDNPDDIIFINWSVHDIEDIVDDEDLDISLDEAIARARKWAPHIADTINNLIFSQLSNVVENDQP